jgi:cation:H+ antiporter
MIWLELAVCASLIIWTASTLSRYADILSEKTGLSKGWVGVILLAGITSQPELASGTCTVDWLKAPNLAAGAIMGSCLINIFLIAILDRSYQPHRVFSREQDAHILAGGLGILMLGMATVATLVGPPFNNFGLWRVSLVSLILIIVFMIGVRLVSYLEKDRTRQKVHKEARVFPFKQISKRRTYGVFALTLIAVILLGVWLSAVGARIATTTGLSRSFVGNLFLAESTSLPEIAASLTAIHLGAVDLVIGNVFGSNLANIFILSFYDLIDGGAKLWTSLTQSNALVAVVAMMMPGIIFISLRFRATSRTNTRISGMAFPFPASIWSPWPYCSCLDECL